MHLATGGKYSIILARRKNTWYSVNDGNWSDYNTWMSNKLDKKIYTSPQPGDDVYINHIVSVDASSILAFSVNNLFINGKLSFTGNASNDYIINGNLIVSPAGMLDISSGINIHLKGYANSMANTSFTAGTGTVIYDGTFDQFILNLSYYNLYSRSTLGKAFSTKYLTSDLSISGSLNVDTCTMDMLNYNFTATGTSNAIATSSSLIRSGTGNTAILTLNTTTVLQNLSIINVGATDIYFTGDIGLVVNSTLTARNVYFNKNNVTIGTSHSSNPWNINANLIIPAGQTANNYQEIHLNNGSTIEGGSNTSIFNHIQNYVYYFWNYSAMSTSGGAFNITSATGSIGYNFSGNITIPYTGMFNLDIIGSGTKSLSGNTTCNGNLTLGTCILDPQTYNLIVATGTFATGFSISRTGVTGKITITGQLSQLNAGSMSLNGTDIEFQGDIVFVFNASISAGNIIFNKTSSAQVLGTTSSGNPTLNANSSAILVKSGVTLRLNTNCQLTAQGVINGVDATSILDNRSILTYQNATAPMATGKLYCNQATNTFIYGLSGNQDITVPSDPTPGYSNLTLNGSGAKRLLGNVSVKATYTLTGPATLNSNGFALTNP